MWAQMVKVRTKPGSTEKIGEANAKWESEVGRAPGSGWLRTQTYRNRADPEEIYLIVHFESEELARKGEQGKRHGELMQELIALLDGPPSYADLELLADATR